MPNTNTAPTRKAWLSRTTIRGMRFTLHEIEVEIIAGRAGVFVYRLTQHGLAGALLHNTRQVEAFTARWPSFAPAVRAAWAEVLNLRAAHMEPHPARVSPRPEAA